MPATAVHKSDKKGKTATAFLGSWRIVRMDAFDDRALNLVEPASISFAKSGQGLVSFCAVSGTLDCRYAERDGLPLVEFSWEGFDESDPVSGRGWAVREDDGFLSGHIYRHGSDDSSFVAELRTRRASLQRD